MDTTDLTNRIQDEQEAQELAEQKRADEEDRGLDRHGEEPDEGLTDEQLYNFRQQNIKALYAMLYSMGLDGKTDKVRAKMDLLSRFFGNIGGVSNISDDELTAISHMLGHLQAISYKFQ
jgi:hypothetical protein